MWRVTKEFDSMPRETKRRWGGPRPGSGRRPLPPGEKLSERVTVNLTKREHAELIKAAGKESPGSFLRRLFNRYLARRKR